MGELFGFLRRRRLWIAFAAVFLSLVVLLSLQYTWLVRLERTSALAHQASLTAFLDAVAAEVRQVYDEAPRRALEIPAAVFTGARCDLAAPWFSQRRVEGARRLFAVDLSGEGAGEMFVWDPVAGAEVEPSPQEGRAIVLAVGPWRMLAQRDLELGTASLRVEDQDPYFRILLLPTVDARSRVVGVAGMVVDPAQLTRVVATAVDRVLPGAMRARQARDNLVVTVRDRAGRPLFQSVPSPDAPDVAVRAMPAVFSDWRLGLRSRYVTPEQWARANFAMNLTLAVLLAGVLVAGMVLALRTASREVALSRMKSDFVSNVSHELRTPLSSILVFAELLRHGRVREASRVRAYGAYIEGESRRLGLLIDNVLDFATIESGRKTYRFQTEDLRGVASEVVSTFQMREGPQGFAIRFTAPPAEPLPVRMDASAIAQAVHNLLDNAVKYSGDSRRVEVGASRQGREVVLAVQDWGIGIPRREWSKVFERFHRVGRGLVHEVKGSGLGLAIVAHVARAHGGRVVLESEPGRGSTFTLRLPAASA